MLLTLGQKRCWCWKWLFLLLYCNLPTHMSRHLQQPPPPKSIWPRILAQSQCFIKNYLNSPCDWTVIFSPLDSQLYQFIFFLLVHSKNQNCMRNETVINSWSLIGPLVLIDHAFVKCSWLSFIFLNACQPCSTLSEFKTPPPHALW